MIIYKLVWHKIKLGHVIYCYSATQKKRTAYNKSLCKWGHFEKAKTTFKMLLATWFFVCFFKRFRCFIAENSESIGQRAAKLPVIKLWEWFDCVQALNPGRLVRVGPGPVGRLFLETSNFESWQLCSPLTYRFHTTSVERSKPLFKVGQEFKRLATF